MLLKYIYRDGCHIEADKNGNIIISTDSEEHKFNENDKPIYKTGTGETVIEYTGLKVDGNPNQSWAGASYAPHAYSELHYHEVLTEDYYIVSGQATLITNNETHNLSAGDHISILPGTQHQVINNSNQTLKLIVRCKPSWTPDDFHAVATNKPQI